LGEGVGAYGGAAQGGQVAAGAKGGTEIAGEGADVRAARAADRGVHVEEVADGADGGDAELVDRHRAGGQLRCLAGPGELVGSLAVDLDRAHARGDLEDVAGELGDFALEGRARHRAGGAAARRLPL